MWSRIRPRCEISFGKSIAGAFSNSRSPREYEFATDSFGYKAKSVVQPDHAEAINRVLTPSSEAVARALRIIEAFEAARALGQARALVDGDLVEVPGYLGAKRTYDRAKALGLA